ncbi:DUF255 domain-containing protein [Chitinophaga sancti]|uniref:thioredoxin family protein n=1 Tax=Chitinophaga sancti TaxID=1004 RepID=UPI002A753C7D|nr:DUF255 domain-containing protein [Chitinophaga sancti]WPQ63345.1 DUF255 domain-containing protein [Chitinophaga sancti]
MKKKHAFFSFLVFLSISALSQQKGIKFEQDLSLNQIFEKAKAENKYVFIDCYASWCGPCKAMERDIYSSEEVGSQMNKNFISIKFQLDSTSNDNPSIKQSYTDAHNLQFKYNIYAFPTLLFFTPNGEIIHRGLGYMDKSKMISLAEDARNPDKQYYTILNDYKLGKLDYSEYPELAKAAKLYGDQATEKDIVENYNEEYLNKLTIDKLCAKKNIRFWMDHFNLFTTSNRLFIVCLNQPEKLEYYRKDFAKDVIKIVITKDIVIPLLYNGNQPISLNPDWSNIRTIIAQKFGNQSVEEIITDSQIDFYRKIENWGKYVSLYEKKYNERQLKPGGGFGGDAFKLNQAAWDVFLSCNDKKIIQHAINWINLSIKIGGNNDPNLYAYYDTKANLLYKLGKINDAIQLEQMAIDSHFRSTGNKSTYYEEVMAVMKKGEPTWDGRF